MILYRWWFIKWADEDSIDWPVKGKMRNLSSKILLGWSQTWSNKLDMIDLKKGKVKIDCRDWGEINLNNGPSTFRVWGEINLNNGPSTFCVFEAPA